MISDSPRTYIEKDAAEWERDGWTSCPNSILRDSELPWELRAVWAWLASHTATFEMTAEKLRQAGPKGRDWAYNALKELERHGLLTRHHEITETGQVVIRYRLHHRAVPEPERTYVPPKSAARKRPHPASTARTPDGSGTRPEQRVPGRSGVRSDQRIPGESGISGGSNACIPGGSGVPYKEEKTKREEDPLPRENSTTTLAVELGATEEEMTLLIEKVRRDHPYVKVPSAWLRRCHENGDLSAMLAEVRVPLAAVPPPAPARCGQCDAKYDNDPISARVVWLADGTSVRCPRCHPLAQAAS